MQLQNWWTADTKAEELRPKIDEKKIEIRTWMETNNVPPDIDKIRRSELVKRIDHEVDVKFICSVVANDNAIIQRHICMETLIRVIATENSFLSLSRNGY
ncbi:hypothetical protein Pyn_32370 [Prunus yedoensis var. nudiflora]|uniref:Uncharacterized protein n=1 Tax=Prunus yedoensis var. nudiflora TaxID=2094558 RepID=A0A314U874_PRUYE|nr:hypothetical protein Pyn_32370 [Prunus yedoensis var. nudiflora]